MDDFYHTIEAPIEGLYKEKGSKFIAYGFPVADEEEIQASLDEVRKLHPKARHHCYAFRLGIGGHRFRANDDGEPSGTAGKPILGQLIKRELTNIIVIVVRYFGGTLLGTSGLIRAYKESTIDALEQASIIKEIVDDVFILTFDYAIMSNVMNTVKSLEINIVEQSFENSGQLKIAIRKSMTATVLPRLKAGILGIRVAELDHQQGDSDLFSLSAQN